MHVKKVTQKDRYGNTMSYEFEVPEKGVDQTKLMEKAMELGVPPMTDMSMDMEMSMGDPMSHPGGPRGSDTVPAWLTPGEFVVNAEAMSIPGVEEQITNINNAGRAMQQGGMAMGYQQGGKVAKAIGQLVQQQKDEVPFLAGPMLTDEAVYRDLGGEISKWWNAPKYYKPRRGFENEHHRRNWNKAKDRFEKDNPSLLGSIARGLWGEAGEAAGALQEAGQAAGTRQQRSAAKRAAIRDNKHRWGNMSPDQQEALISEYLQGGYLNEGGAAMPVPMLDALLHSREGYRDDVYLDSLGKPTVGAGHLLPNEYKERVGERPFTKAQLDAMFDEDRKTAEAAAQRNVSPEAWKKLNKRQQATLASMAFQLGEKGQSKFKNMLKAIEAGDYTEAAKQAVTGSKGGKSKWLKQTPVRALDLAEAFDPNIAAMYRNAGGAVYDDRDAQYAFWGKKIEPAEVQYSPQQQMLNDFLDAGYSPEEALAATKQALATANVPEDAPPIPQHPQPVPTPDTAWADNLAGIDWSLPEDREGRTIEDNAPVPEMDAPMPTPHGSMDVPEYRDGRAGSVTDDMGLLGNVVDWFGGPSGAAQAEHEERYDQQSGVIAENAQTAADVANVAAEQATAELENIPLTDTEARSEQREEIARLETEAAQAEETAAESADYAQKVSEYKAMDSIKNEIAALDKAIVNTDNAEDKAALQQQKAELEGQAAAIQGGQDAASAEAETLPTTKAEGETPESDPTVEGDGMGAAEQAMADADAAHRQKAQNEAKSIFSDLGLDSLFDGKELARMAVMYAGSRLLGYGHGGSLNWAAKNYISRIDAKEAGFSKLALSGKYKPESLAKFKKSGNYSDLEPVGAATTITGNTMTRTVGGKRQVFQEVKVGDNTLYRTPDGSTFTAAQIEGSTQPYEAAFEKGTPEYRARRSRATGDAAGRFEEVWKAEDTIPGGRDKPDSHFTNIRPKQAADEFWGWSESMGLDPESDEALQIMTNAYQQAIADGKTGEVKPSSLKPYLEQQYIREKSGRPELFMTNEPKPGERPKYIRGDKMAALDRQIKSVASAMPALRGLSGKDAADRFYSLAADEWAGLTEEEQKTFKKSAGNDESGFYIYLQQRAADLMSQTQ